MNTPAPIERLVASGEKLSTSVRCQLLAAGPAIVPELIALIEADLAHEPPDDTWAALHAAGLLGEIGDSRAVPVLIRCLAECSGLMLLHEQAFKALIGLGAAALDSCLETYASSDNASLRNDMACVLSRLQIKDERIFKVLAETLSRNPVVGANALFDYGDPGALALLSEAFDRQPIEPSESLLDNHIFIELRAAIIDLGGQLTAAQADKYAQAMRVRERWVARTFGSMVAADSKAPAQRLTPNRPKRGRNDPCWCGGGKKYKRCHGPQER